jgi:hypothetical protein
MNFVEGCPECRRISAKYEAATIEWFRVQGQLGIAEHLRDPETSAKFVAELSGIAKRRQSLRDTANRHIAKIHASVKAGGG